MAVVKVQIPEYRIRQTPVGFWKIGEATERPSRWKRFWAKFFLGWEWENYS